MSQSSLQHLPEVQRLLLVVVNYNQQDEIESFLGRLTEYFPVSNTVVVDDCSEDQSPQLARAAGYHVLSHSINHGIGAAIRTGIQYGCEQGYSFVAIMSSNGKMRPEDLEDIITPVLLGEVDYSTGSRFIPGGASPGLSWFRRFSIPIFSLFAWPLLGRRFSDVTCGFRCYRLEMFKDSRVRIEQNWLDRYEMEYYIHYWACSMKLRIQEVPVTITYNHLASDRQTKIRPITGWWSMIRPLIFLKCGIRK